MKQHKETLVFVGSLNRAVPHFAAANGRGISILSLDEESGKLRQLNELGGMDNPTYLAVVPSRTMLYATSETFGDAEGFIASYRYDDATGTMTEIGERRATRGSLSAHCSTDRDGRYAFVANYAHETPGEAPGRHVVAYAVQADGSLSAAVREFAHSGSGPNQERQGVPHAHCVVASPDNQFALVTDLGTDTISTYRIGGEECALLAPEIEALRVKPASGPRHLVFHPTLDCVYVVNELNNTLCRLSYDRASGALAIEQTIEVDVASSAAADIAIANDGRFLYASFRGADCIGVFALAEDGCIVECCGTHPSGGRTPRSFTLSPSGRFLLAANQNSDNLVVWRLDDANGCIVEKADQVEIGTPMCIKCVA
ncbi:lactonase family protein [Caballeronia sp. S22]|uniref:lactonase family protein n=1 Tax=Caballeronia sp. S22 TaxID=3137182 RepID=UPI0035306758